MRKRENVLSMLSNLIDAIFVISLNDRIMDIMYVFSKFKLKKAWFIAKYAFSIHILYRNLVPI